MLTCDFRPLTPLLAFKLVRPLTGSPGWSGPCSKQACCYCNRPAQLPRPRRQKPKEPGPRRHLDGIAISQTSHSFSS